MSDTDESRILRTTHGDLPLEEYRLRAEGREWGVLHTGAVLSLRDEAAYLELHHGLPFGLALWPSSVALAHDLLARADALRGARVLELGAGTGLPGIVAASLGAHVVQVDRQPAALALAERNARRNGAATVERRLADWTAWDDDARYAWIVGADVLYAPGVHAALRAILERNLAPGGTVLLADPLRPQALPLLEAMERDGWRVTVARWTIATGDAPRAMVVYELKA